MNDIYDVNNMNGINNTKYDFPTAPAARYDLTVFAAEPAYFEEAQALADKLGVDFTEDKNEADSRSLALRFDSGGLALTGGGLELRGDLTQMSRRLKPNNLNGELIVKAAKLKDAGERPLAVDATAGLGEDSILLAAAGFSVMLFERDPIIAALLRDALRRAAESDETVIRESAARMCLFEEDSLQALPRLAERPDIVVLDPMFPERQKSALVKKKFQLLHKIERPCADGAEMLEAALAASPRKIIIKRPLKGPYLADRKPDYSLRGKAVRYDCIVIPRS